MRVELEIINFKELRGTDDWIVPGTKMTQNVPFLLNESSKIQIFTDIL